MVVDELEKVVVFRFLVGEADAGGVRLGWLSEERLLRDRGGCVLWATLVWNLREGRGGSDEHDGLSVGIFV